MQTTRKNMSASARSRGFTIIELSVVVIIIALLSGILLVAVRTSLLSARVAGEKQVCTALKAGVSQFKQQFGFLPPLVLDSATLQNDQPNIDPLGDVLNLRYQADQNTPNFDRFYSVNTLGLYLIGAADAKVDGVDGPGFTQPNEASGDTPAGLFSKKGKTYEPLFDINRDRRRLAVDLTTNAASPQYTIIDRWGKALRYYRWQASFYKANDQAVPAGLRGTIRKDASGTPLYNVPSVVANTLIAGSRDKKAGDFPELRDGGFAIVSSGPDGKFSDDVSPADPSLDVDNIVEIGK